MAVDLLAEPNLAYLAGSLLGTLLVPALGIGVLIFGLRHRRTDRATGTAWAVMGAVLLLFGLIGACSTAMS